MMHRFFIIVLLMGVLAPRHSLSHEVRPAYLEITQTTEHHYEIVWKQPTQGELAVHLVPHLSNGWLERTPFDQYAASGFLIRTWSIDAEQGEKLSGATIDIEGLQDTITDALIHLRGLNGESLHTVLRPEQPRFVIKLEHASNFSTSAYLLLGIEHILTGPDHLVFVLGLLLIVRQRRALLKTVSAFTLAHSLTLTATVLGKITLPVSFVESLIALSILFLAPEILRAQRGGSSVTLRFPWLVAFAFGLFHGMGFASGLTALGFKSDNLFATLALFNIGVELGQLGFIALMYLLANALSLMQGGGLRYATRIPAYIVGIGGAYWAIQCGVQWLGVQL